MKPSRSTQDPSAEHDASESDDGSTTARVVRAVLTTGLRLTRFSSTPGSRHFHVQATTPVCDVADAAATVETASLQASTSGLTTRGSGGQVADGKE